MTLVSAIAKDGRGGLLYGTEENIMQEFTRTEIGWITEAVKLTREYYAQVCRRSTDSAEQAFANLRAEQLERCEDKLRRALDGGDKRMAIK